MVDLRWDGDDFRNEQSSSGTTADLVSHSGKLQQGYQHGSLTRGLVAYYPMEKGQGEILHDGATGNQGQINGAIWNGNGQVGSDCLSFNGTDAFVDIGTNSFTSSQLSEGTIVSWVKFDTLPSTAGNDMHQVDIEVEALISGQSEDDRITGYLYDGNTNYLDGPVISTNTWYHVTLTWNGSTARLFVDGSEQKSASVGSPTLSNQSRPTYIGAQALDDFYHDGVIDDVRIYDRALSQPEIQALYNITQPSGTQVTEKQVPGQNQGGVSRYKLNGDVTDSWGSNNGTNNGADLTTTGVYGQAATFNGTGDYVDISTTGITHSYPFSVSVWTTANSTNNNTVVLYGENSSNTDEEWGLQKGQTNGVPFIYLRDSQGTSSRADASTSITDGGWHHIVATATASETRIYVDGSLEGTGSVASSALNGIDDEDIGRRPITQDLYWDGEMDDLRVYNAALSPQKVEKLYHKGAYRIPRESTLQ